MKVTRRHLRQIIKEEFNRVLNEATRSKPWAWEDPHSSPDPESYDTNMDGALDAAELRSIADDLGEDAEDYPKEVRYTHPKTGQKVMKNVWSSEEFEREMGTLLRQYPKLPYSIDEGAQEITRSNARSVIDAEGVEAAIELIVARVANLQYRVDDLWDEYEPI